jgi:Rrf2 family nitric oxide-sensitive transcriptional repressor
MEMISQTAEYSLRAVLHLARHQEIPLTTQQVAKAIHAPAGYLAKVLQALGKAGIVHSQRGLHGGFLLSRPVEKLTLLDVVNAVDPVRRLNRCPLGIEGHDVSLCPLHKRLDQVAAGLQGALSKATVAQVLHEYECGRPSRPKSRR